MSVDFSQIINNFLSAELGEEVRGSLVAIARALQNAINSQLNTVTSDLTDPSANAAARAKTVGDLFEKTPYFNGILGADSTATPPVTISVKSVTGNAFYALSGDTSRYIYTDLPEGATSAAGYLLSETS